MLHGDQQGRLRLAYVNDLLTRHDWSWFGTLMLRPGASVPEALAARRAWLRRISKALGKHITVAATLDYTKGATPHFHILLAAPELDIDFDREQAHRAWSASAGKRAGRTRFTKFRPGTGAYYYLTKNDGAPDVVVACPRPARCRRSKRGCTEAPGLW
jgi:hypothetical protein